MYYVYKITNLLNGKIYVGLTTNFRNRVRTHKSSANSGRHNYPLYNAMNKYGFDNFKFEIIETFSTEEQMISGEIKWILFYKSQNENFGYNLRGGGELPYHTGESIKKQQSSSYSRGKRKFDKSSSEYKCVSKSKNAFISYIIVYGERIHLGAFRTELEAAWAYDEAVRVNFDNKSNVFLNFPSGITKEVIREKMTTEKLLSTVKYTYFDTAFGGAYRGKYYIRIREIGTSVDKVVFTSKNKIDCDDFLKNMIKDNKYIKKYRGCLSTIVREYEKLHGSIYDLISDEELEEAYRNQLGTFE